MANHSTAIANEFIRRAKKDGKQLTHMQLQKLVYIAHGWSLAVTGSPLTEDSPEAWDYGPVYPELWEALKMYGSAPVTRPIQYMDFGRGLFRDNPKDEVVAQLTTDENTLIDRVYELYSDFRAFQLSAMTHEQDTPWHKLYVEEKTKGGVIKNDNIKSHFIEIAAERQTATAT